MNRQVVDAHGRRARAFEGGALARSREDESQITSGEITRLRRRLLRMTPLAERPSRVVRIIMWGMVAAALAVLLLTPMTRSMGMALRVGVAAALVWWAARPDRSFGFASPTDIVRVMLDAQRCPSCGYLLRDVPAQPDGCVVCPECAAAWRLPDQPPATTSPAQTTTSTGLPPNS